MGKESRKRRKERREKGKKLLGLLKIDEKPPSLKEQMENLRSLLMDLVEKAHQKHPDNEKRRVKYIQSLGLR